MKKCVLILPYFGKFNNYFQLFLNSFSYNTDYQLLIFTDNTERYDYPSNVTVIPYTLNRIKKRLDKVLNMNVCLDTPYKLCDYKPTYGLVFQDYIKEYQYWGHCDCDLLFGNLNKLLTPLLEKKYDKIFAAGHLTIYKNDYDINRLFMKTYRGVKCYKEAFMSDDIYVFDEDFKDNNVHRIFLEERKNIYDEDLSMNPTSRKAHFVRSYYSPSTRKFEWEDEKKARYYWYKGQIIEIERKDKQLVYSEYIYMHLQARTMHMNEQIVNKNCIQILPDRFVEEIMIPRNVKEFKPVFVWSPNRFWIDTYIKKIKRKWKGAFCKCKKN